MMVCNARLSCRSPPRLRRCRLVRPLLASSGLAPARAANAASLRQRPTWENDTIPCAPLNGPTPLRSSRPGANALTKARRPFSFAVSSRSAARIATASRRASPRRTACSVVSCCRPRRRAIWSRWALLIAHLPGPDRADLLPGDQQDPHRFPVTIVAGQHLPVHRHPQHSQRGQVRVDRVGLPAAPLAPLGLLHLDHVQARGLPCPGQPDPIAAGAFQPDQHPPARACSTIQAIASSYPSASLSMLIVEISTPCPVSISNRWVSRWVSPPTTASNNGTSSIPSLFSASIVMIPGLLPDQGSGTTPAWEEVTPRHICDESRTPPRGVDRLLIKPTRWTRPASAPRKTSQLQGTPKRPDPRRVIPKHHHRSWQQPLPRPTHQHSQIRAG